MYETDVSSHFHFVRIFFEVSQLLYVSKNFYHFNTNRYKKYYKILKITL